MKKLVNRLRDIAEQNDIIYYEAADALEALEAENLGLRLECHGLKAEVAEYKSYWKEATRKNRSILEENADLALLADQYKIERDRLRANLHSAAKIGGQP